MMAGDIKISTQILSEVVKFNEQFANGIVADQGDIEVSERIPFGQFRSLVAQSGIIKNLDLPRFVADGNSQITSQICLRSRQLASRS